MYKLLFADNEAIVLDSLPKMIDWGGIGFELAGCCANGHDLLEMAEKVRPDLVITDINMPFVNGLEAARQIRSDSPNTRIVFLTGYTEFEYAQQAIEVKAEKYIIKPISSGKLCELLVEIKKNLDKEYEFYSDLSVLKQFYNQNYGVMQSLFLNNMLLVGMSEKDIEEKIRILDIKCLEGKQFCVTILKRDDKRDTDESLLITPDLENFALFNISNELLSESGAGLAVIMNDYTALVFSSDNTDEMAFSETIEKTLGEVIAAVERFLKFPVIAGVGRMCSARKDMHNSFKEASAALNYSRVLGDHRIIFIQDIGSYKNNFQRFDIHNEKRLIEALRVCDRETVFTEVRRILDSLGFRDKGTSKLYIFDLLLELFLESQNLGLDVRGILNARKLADLLYDDNPDEMFSVITECCENIILGIEKQSRSTYIQYLELAQKFIAEHYSDPDLSIDAICKSMNISASHLRTIFRKELNMTFIKYLNTVRLERARRLILTSNLKNFEISNMVGFNSPHYFSFCFKQYLGMSPSEIREQNK